MLLLLCLSSLAQDNSGYRILLKNGAFIPEKNITATKLEVFNGNANRSNGKKFAIIQFEQIPTESERKILRGGFQCARRSWRVPAGASPARVGR